MPLAALLSFVVGAGAVQAATVSSPGFNASVTTAVTPTRLPRTGGASISLAITGSINRTDFNQASAIRYIDIRLDRQLAVDTEGLPICRSADIEYAEPPVARKKCRSALIGSGTANRTLHFDGGPLDQHFVILFFNARIKGRPEILVYTGYGYVKPIGSGRAFRVPGADDPYPVASESFQYRLGRTWTYRGRKHSYLSARCATGALKNQITLTLTDGVMSEATPQSCTKRS